MIRLTGWEKYALQISETFLTALGMWHAHACTAQATEPVLKKDKRGMRDGL